MIQKGIYITLFFCTVLFGQNKAIVSGEVWNDTNGNPLNAHGGGILFHKDCYY